MLLIRSKTTNNHSICIKKVIVSIQGPVYVHVYIATSITWCGSYLVRTCTLVFDNEKKNTRTNLVFVNGCVFFLLANSNPGTHDFAKSRMRSIVINAYFQVCPFNRRVEDQLMHRFSHIRSGHGNTFNLQVGNIFNFYLGQASSPVTKE